MTIIPPPDAMTEPPPNVTTPVTPGSPEWNEAFREGPLPLDRNTFGMALVLGGTVSAGAYTAGVLDYLVEALDAWEAEKDKEDKLVLSKQMTDEQRTVPTHRVALTIVTGSSGGGVCGGILARALAYDFPHIHCAPGTNAPVEGNPQLNPFWNVWVDKLRIEGLLETAKPDKSLLCPDPIDQAAQAAAGFTSPTRRVRRWVHEKFQLVMALTNLRGILYATAFGGNGVNKQCFIDRADNVRFGVDPTGTSNRQKACNEYALLQPTSPDLDWQAMAAFAKATGAFPVGFPARLMQRPITDYRFRPLTVAKEYKPSEDCLPKSCASLGVVKMEVRQQLVDGPSMLAEGMSLSGDYQFLTVDAGATNNAPVELARTWLSGLLGRNKQEPESADRAVVLIDPFAETPASGPAKDRPLLKVAIDLLAGLVQQSRYQTRDLVLAGDPNVHSRFMLTASRSDPRGNGHTLVGGDAICSARLGAFFGFLRREYSMHDYFLGRHNCQRFLQEEFLLFDNNPCLNYSKQAHSVYSHKDSQGQWLPIIPLVGTLRKQEPLPSWPRLPGFDPESLRPRLRLRLTAVIDIQFGIMAEGMPWWWRLIGKVIKTVGEWALIRPLCSWIIRAVTAAKSGTRDGKPPLPPL